MRIDYSGVLPESVSSIMAIHMVVAASSLERDLLELVKLRASQINGCAYCVDMHSKDARAMGETEQRLYLTSAWREAECFTPRERAALAWTESLTLLSQTGAPDDVYNEVAAVFSENEIVALTLAICEINSWNRLSVGMRTPVGDYVSPHGKRTTARSGNGRGSRP